MPCKRPGEKLDGAEGEVVLDFSSVRRIDPSCAASDGRVCRRCADGKAVKVVLRGVNIDVYKVLKLVKLASAIFIRELRYALRDNAKQEAVMQNHQQRDRLSWGDARFPVPGTGGHAAQHGLRRRA